MEDKTVNLRTEYIPSPVKVRLTNYWMVEKDDPSTYSEYRDHAGDMNVRLKSGGVVILPASFCEAVRMEGCGLLSKLGVLIFDGKEWDILDPHRFPWGKGCRDNPLVPFLSIAVDKNLVPIGSCWTIRDLGQRVRADDTGGAIKGAHVDLFVGRKRDRIDGDKPNPWMVWLDPA